MLLKVNSKGDDVKLLLEKLGLKADGVFGPKTELAVKNWQEEHGLKADGIVGDKTWEALFKDDYSFLIVKDFINVHITKAPGRLIKYIVVHYTAGGTSKAGAAKKNRDVFEAREASADFVVDDETIIQVNPDPRNYYCWAVGDGKGKYGIYNKDCISIEMCSNLMKGTSAKVPNHEGWYLTDAVVDKTVALVKYLMELYNIPIENVIRHYDATHKLCPGIIGWNPGVIYNAKTSEKTNNYNNEEQWLEFKNRLA